MKRTYKIEVDCANCANKMEETANKVKGVKKAIVNFMMLKMDVEFEDDANVDEVMKEVIKACKKSEADSKIYL